ncbi:MAG: hypothetical protein ACYS0H_11825, partial [Planctomycetota bacterium]
MGNQTNVVTGRAVLVFLAVLVGAATVAGGGMGGGTLTPRFFYVDAADGDDTNEGLTPGTAFATIQKAVATAADGDAVLVFPGLYRGEVSFRGKALL